MQALGETILNMKAHKNPNDYIENGILHCGNCKTPKEHEVNFSGLSIVKKMPIPCKCQAEKDAEQAEKMKQAEFEAWRARTIREGLGSETNRECTFDRDDLSNPNVSAICRAYVNEWDKAKENNLGLLFYGSVGTGKTFHALTVANGLIDKGVSVRFTSITRELSKIQGAYPEDRQMILDKLFNCDLLILDDVGAERDTSYALEQVYTIVDGRYASNKPCLATTNLSLNELQKPSTTGYERIYDRILAMCQLRLKIEGKSKRIDQAKAKEQEALEILGLKK